MNGLLALVQVRLSQSNQMTRIPHILLLVSQTDVRHIIIQKIFRLLLVFLLIVLRWLLVRKLGRRMLLSTCIPQHLRRPKEPHTLPARVTVQRRILIWRILMVVLLLLPILMMYNLELLRSLEILTI